MERGWLIPVLPRALGHGVDICYIGIVFIVSDVMAKADPRSCWDNCVSESLRADSFSEPAVLLGRPYDQRCLAQWSEQPDRS
jgi:hypothetical protein